MKTLKEAHKFDQIDELVKEREGAPISDAQSFKKIMISMAGKSKATRKTSSQGGSGD